MDAARAITNTRGGDLADLLPLRAIVSRMRAIKITSLPQLNDCGGATDADAVRVNQEVGQLAFAGRPHSFFWMTSCSICLSRLRSSTMRLSAGVLFFQLFKAAPLADTQVAVFLLPVVEGGFRDTHLAADLGDGGAGFRLAQCEGDLFFGELRFFHDKPPARMGLNLPEISTFRRYVFAGGGQNTFLARSSPIVLMGHLEKPHFSKFRCNKINKLLGDFCQSGGLFEVPNVHGDAPFDQ